MIALMAFGIRSLFRGSTGERTGGGAAFILTVSDLEDGAWEHLHAGDRLIDRKSRSILGTVASVTAAAQTYPIYNEKRGTLEEAIDPTRTRIEIAVVPSDASREIGIGEQISFRSFDFQGAGEVTRILR